MNVVEYLCREARRITSSSLSRLPSAEQWVREREERWRAFVEMLGLDGYLDGKPRGAPEYEVTGVIERDGYKIEKLYFESLPGLYVTCNLYVPEEKGAKPAALYLCGHAFDQKHHYQLHGHKLAGLGFVTLIVETIQKGEVRGHHHGPYHRGWFNWYSLGYTPAGVEVWNAVRALDLLQRLPGVDSSRMGATGISGGGAMTWFTAAVDDRVKAAAPVCSTGTVESHVCKRTLDHHCDCMFWINTRMWDMPDVGALIAPRPLLIVAAARDWIYDVQSVKVVYERLKPLYEMLGAPENLRLVVTPSGHSYHEDSRVAIYAWFIKHLRGAEPDLEALRAYDREPVEEVESQRLRVFAEPPQDERVSTVHEWFARPAEAPAIKTAEDLERFKERVLQALRRAPFAWFPDEPCNLDVRVELEQEDEKWIGYRISFTSEEGWRLKMQVYRPKDVEPPVPVLLLVTESGRSLTFGEPLSGGLDPTVARAVVEVRGVGETSWGSEIQWFVRRAAMLVGRTVASMRVYDALRALEVLEQLEWVDRSRMGIMGSGEMSVVAVYAALLRGGLRAVVLHNPPPSHNIPSNPDGTGPAVELLGVLRVLDLPVATGLLWPAELVFLGPRSAAYAWTEELYLKLGPPGKERHVKQLSEWQPCSLAR